MLLAMGTVLERTGDGKGDGAFKELKGIQVSWNVKHEREEAGSGAEASSGRASGPR